MKIAKIEDLHCAAGWRTFSFLKVTTDDGLIGCATPGAPTGASGSSGKSTGPGPLPLPLPMRTPDPGQFLARSCSRPGTLVMSVSRSLLHSNRSARSASTRGKDRRISPR